MVGSDVCPSAIGVAVASIPIELMVAIGGDKTQLGVPFAQALAHTQAELVGVRAVVVVTNAPDLAIDLLVLLQLIQCMIGHGPVVGAARAAEQHGVLVAGKIVREAQARLERFFEGLAAVAI